MGTSQSRRNSISAQEIQRMVAQLHLSPAEIQDLHQQFRLVSRLLCADWSAMYCDNNYRACAKKHFQLTTVCHFRKLYSMSLPSFCGCFHRYHVNLGCSNSKSHILLMNGINDVYRVRITSNFCLIAINYIFICKDITSK